MAAGTIQFSIIIFTVWYSVVFIFSLMRHALLPMSLFMLTLFGCAGEKNAAGFDKIIYHTTSCFGDCPTYHLELDSEKNVKLYAEQVLKPNWRIKFEKDTARMGYFTGVANDSSFNKLSGIVNSIGLDTLNFKWADCCDAPITTIIVYYDGKRRNFASMFPPEKARPLIDALMEICQHSQVKRTKETFAIEQRMVAGEGTTD